MATSPQTEILDQLIWSRLSSFWKRNYDPSDLEALNAVFEGSLAVLDAEYVRLFEINAAKSLMTVPINSQRRWLRLDLNRYDDLYAFLKFLASDAVTGAANASTVGTTSDTLNCIPLQSNHPRHWHIQFPYVVPAGDPISRASVNLSYPTELALVIVHKMMINPVTGRKEAKRLKPGIDYTILQNGTTIRLSTTSVGDEFEFNVALNFTSATFDGLKVVTAYASGIDRLGPNVVPVPIGLSRANLPIHALVVRNVVDNGTGGLQQTNNATFTTTYEFYPFTGDFNGPQHGAAPGQVALPPAIAPLSASDAVFVFGLQAGEWDIAHRHDVATTYLNPGANPSIGGPTATAGSTNIVEFTKLIQPGIFGSLGYLGQTLEVYIDGDLLHYSEYQVNSDNQLVMKTPISWADNEYVAIDVRFAVEYNTIQQILGDQHLHYACVLAVAAPIQEAATFDDGGNFDDGGVLDDSFAINSLYIADVLGDAGTVEIFINGVYANPGVEYTATTDPTTGRILLAFAVNITGASVLATYRRDTRTYIYGDFATSSFGNNIFGGNRSTLSGLLTDVQGLIASFGQSYQFGAQNVSNLIKGATVAAAGGNPFLTLFFDEFDEYADLPIDAPNQPFDAQTARTLESYNQDMTSIPFLTDHVLNPTVRLTEGQDYDIVDGKMLSSVDLLAPRGPNDKNPGVWWCPVVLLDENFLAKNFGSLVGDIRPSSIPYKQALQANFWLRYSGPIKQNVQWALAVMLGSPAFTQDSTILSTNADIVGYRVTVGNQYTQQVAFVPAPVVPLQVGIDVVPTQSLSQAPVFDGTFQNLLSVNLNSLFIQQNIQTQPGDVVKFSLLNPADPTQTPIPFSSTVVQSFVDNSGLLPVTQIALKDTPRFPPSLSQRVLILRQGQAPFATIEGTVLSVVPVQQYVVRTAQESFTLAEGQLPEYRVGQSVFRGMPLFPSYAVLYDDADRPNWHWQTPADVRKDFNYKVLGLGQNVQFTPPADNRTATVNPPANPGGYSFMALAPVNPAPLRGSTIKFVDQATNDTLTFTVIGNSPSGVLVTPQVSVIKNGTAILTPTESDSEYFEAPSPAQNALIETALTFPQLVRSSSLQVASTHAFPAAGKIAIRLPNGGATEFIYGSKSDGFFLDITWPSDFPAMTGPSPGSGAPGALNPVIPINSVLRLVSAFTTRRINPAFLALVSQRVVRDVTNGSTNIVVSEQNADILYGLMKTGATVFESRAVTYPSIVNDVLTDLVPTTTTMVPISKHVIVDAYAGGVNED